MHRSQRALSGIALIFLSACSSAAQSTKQPLPTDVVATVDQTSITLAEVDERALAQPVGNFSALRLVDALYEARRGAIDDMINARLLEREAKAEGIAMTDLLQREITGRVVPPTELDVAAWYKANPTRVQGAPIKEVREPIKNLLHGERTNAARRDYLEILRAKTSDLGQTGSTARENRRRRTTEPRSGERAGGDRRVLRLSVPVLSERLPNGQQGARRRTETRSDSSTATTRCRTTRTPVQRPKPRPAPPNRANSGRITTVSFRAPASSPNPTSRNTPLLSALMRLRSTPVSTPASIEKDVEDDMEAANAIGVNGTPAFFINGRALNGAQPFDAFKRMIDEELE